MPWYLKLLQRRLMDEESGSDGTGNGGGGPGDGDGGGEGDGKGKPNGDLTISDAEAKLLREVMQKKEKLKELEKKFEVVDPERYRKLIADEDKRAKEAEEAETKAAEARGDFERVKAQMVEQHGKDKAELQRQIEELSKALSGKASVIDELTIGNSFGQSRYIPEKTNLSTNKARQLYGSHFEQKEGRIIAYDKPAGESERTPLVDGNGDPLSFEAALIKIIEADPDRDLVLKPTVKPGGNSTTTNGRGADKSQDKDLSGLSRINAGLSALTKKTK